MIDSLLDTGLTLREIDIRTGQPKGTAFRAFRRLEPQANEGKDFWVLQAGNDAALIDALRNSNRIYPGSVNVVIVSARFADLIVAALEAGTPPDSDATHQHTSG